LLYDEFLVCKWCYEKLPLAKTCGNNWGIFEFGGKTWFEKVEFPFLYEAQVKDWIRKIKFGKKFELAIELGKLLKKYLNVRSNFDVVVPIPLSIERLKERGFNQSALIARTCFGKKVEESVLKRTKNTLPQATLSKKERLKNVKGAFKVEKDVGGLKILLFDDVLTTGATLNEAAKVLKLAGAERVSALVVAKNVIDEV